MNTTLLLNASYEPIGGICTRRAVVLVLTGRAELVEAGERMIRSPSTAVPEPAVIRLLRYVKRVVRRTREPSCSKQGVLERDGHTCQYCGAHADTIDHVVPRAKGGVTSWTNCVAACDSCNWEKGSSTLDELGWQLRREPHPPSTGVVVLRMRPSRTVPEVWQPYIEAWA